MASAPAQPTRPFLDRVETDAARVLAAHTYACEYRPRGMLAATAGATVMAAVVRIAQREAAGGGVPGSISGRPSGLAAGGASGERRVAKLTVPVAPRAAAVNGATGVTADGAVGLLQTGDQLVVPGVALKETGGDVVVGVAKILSRSAAFWVAEVVW